MIHMYNWHVHHRDVLLVLLIGFEFEMILYFYLFIYLYIRMRVIIQMMISCKSIVFDS